jgi:hypothetical protein
VAGVEEGAPVEPAQPRLHAGGELGPRRAVGVVAGTLDVQERVRPAEVAACLARLRLGRLDRARRERLEHVLDDVLGGQPLDQLGLLQPHGRLVGDGPQELRVLLAEAAAAYEAAQHAELLLPRHQRRDQQALVVGHLAPQRAGAVAAFAPHQVEEQRGAPWPHPGVRRVGRVGGRHDQLVRLVVEAPDLTGVGAEQLARAAGDRVVEVLPERDRRQRLAQLRERGQRLHTAARLAVELGVLDRASHQRGRVDQEVEDVVAELARGLGVEHDHPDHLAGLGPHRDGDHRLEALLLQLGHVLHARVLHRVLADELGRPGPGHPTGQTLVEAEPDLPDQVRVAGRGGSQREPVGLHEVDEACVAVGGVRGDLHNAVQHTVQGERGGDGLDDRVQRLVLTPKPVLRHASPPFRRSASLACGAAIQRRS